MKLFLTGSAVALALAACPANAAVIINFDGVAFDQTVLFASSTAIATPTLVAATNNSSTAVTFANTLGLLANASGQSSTTNANGVLVGTTSVTIANGFSFSTAQFNIAGIPGSAPPAEANSVFVEALGIGGSVIGSSILNNLDGNGENRIGISGTAGEVFTGFRITLAPVGAGVDSLSQVRLGGVSRMSAVPEPATWMMMIFGFGAIGAAMRRHKTTVSYA